MHRRGLTPLVGFVILVGITAVGAVGIFIAGGTLADSAQQDVQTEQAERSMQQLAETANEIASGGSDSARFSMSGASTATTEVNHSAGHVNVTLHNGTNTTTLMDGDLGAYRYVDDGGTELAYQGGGIWRVDGDSEPAMLRPPEFDYRNPANSEPTLEFSKIAIRDGGAGAASSTGDLSVVDQIDRTANQTRFTGDHINVTIESEYAAGWARHIRDRTDGAVVQSSADRVTATLTVPDPESGNDSDLNNSSERPGVDRNDSSATVNTEDSNYYPDIDIDAAVETRSSDIKNGDIRGDVLVPAGESVNEGQVSGTVSHGNVEIPDAQSIVDRHISGGNHFQSSVGGSIDSPGTYYVEPGALEVQNGVSVDPSGGPVHIVVDGDLRYSGNSWLDVQSGENVYVYVQGDMNLNSMNAHVGNPADPGQTQFYVNGDVQVSGTDNEHANGIITADGEFSMNSANSHWRGAIMADDVGIGGQATIEYQESVEDREMGSVEPRTTLTVNVEEPDPSPPNILRAENQSGSPAGIKEGIETLVTDGSYTITVNEPGYHGVEKTVAVAPGEATEVNVTLDPKDPEDGLNVSVFNRTSGAPLDNVTINATSSSGPDWNNLSSSENETQVAPGNYSIYVDASGYHSHTEPNVSVEPGKIRTLDVHLGPVENELSDVYYVHLLETDVEIED